MKMPVRGNHHVDCDSGHQHQPYCVDISICVSALVYQHLQFFSAIPISKQLHLLPAAKRFYCEELIKVKYQPSPSWRPEYTRPGDSGGRWPAN